MADPPSGSLEVQKTDPEGASADRENILEEFPAGDGEFPARDGDFPAGDGDIPGISCDLDYYVVEYVMMSQRQRVGSIEQEFGVTIKSVNRVCDEIVTVAFRRYNPTIQAENEEKAHRAFLALYEVVYRRIVQRTVQAKVTNPMTVTNILTAIKGVFKEEVFVSANSEGVFTLVGPYEQVTMVENHILRQNARQSVGNPRAHDDGKSHHDGGEEVGGAGGGDGGSRGPVMSVFEIGGRLTVKVYSADITHLPYDVIVSAANEHLQNYAGVAGAIERAGGEDLRRDCEEVIEQGGPLKVSTHFFL